MANIISFIESDNFEFTMREAQSRNSFQNKVAWVHSVKRWLMARFADKKGRVYGESSFFILNNKLLVLWILWIVLEQR